MTDNIPAAESVPPSYEELIADLAARGITVGNERLCWLRLRRHRFVGYFQGGDYTCGYRAGLCGICGDAVIVASFGLASMDISSRLA